VPSFTGPTRYVAIDFSNFKWFAVEVFGATTSHRRTPKLGKSGKIPSQRRRAQGWTLRLIEPHLRLAGAPVYLLRIDNLARLKVRDQTKQLRPVGASAGCLLVVDAGDVVPGIPRLSDDRFLAIEILPLRLAQNSGKRIAP
jgi:hypothetical protein